MRKRKHTASFWGEGLNNKVTDRQRSDGSDRGGHHVDIWGNHVPGGESSTCKGPEAGLPEEPQGCQCLWNRVSKAGNSL